jgi:hypothetical protein
VAQPDNPIRFTLRSSYVFLSMNYKSSCAFCLNIATQNLGINTQVPC